MFSSKVFNQPTWLSFFTSPHRFCTDFDSITHGHTDQRLYDPPNKFLQCYKNILRFFRRPTGKNYSSSSVIIIILFNILIRCQIWYYESWITLIQWESRFIFGRDLKFSRIFVVVRRFFFQSDEHSVAIVRLVKKKNVWGYWGDIRLRCATRFWIPYVD